MNDRSLGRDGLDLESIRIYRSINVGAGANLLLSYDTPLLKSGSFFI